jgi:hypothetical protein
MAFLSRTLPMLRSLCLLISLANVVKVQILSCPRHTFLHSPTNNDKTEAFASQVWDPDNVNILPTPIDSIENTKPLV